MKFKYNEATASLEIKDGLNSHFLIMKSLLIITFVNAVLNLSNAQVAFGFMKLIWLVLGMVAAIGLYLYYFKKTATENIPLNQIIEIKERVSFGRKKYFLALKNGKTRDLLEVHSASDCKQINTILTKHQK
ncbi:hypothetical protein [Flavobacterium glaciei]|uniref:PH (Pleckstrin Homology) domain-containing protein n=1 Tax=Flavobacterium glaciei TaxID=386300 RepID=A0A562PY72_9FLAO|nr:hypothetical protein [Flavobacterium glaciei]RDI56856.1 hypothetical protein DFR66_10335 [Flavobacterium glaciei]TWI49359.1 hypothetical protein IQ02_00751 [Flavobacterium glaciei]